MVKLSIEVQLIRAVCTVHATKSSVLGSQHQKKRKRSIATPTTKGLRLPAARAPVVRSCTCVTTTPVIFPCPTESRSRCLQRACQPFCTVPQASDPDTRFVSRIAVTWLLGASGTPPSPCPGTKIVRTAVLRCSSSSCASSSSPLPASSLGSNTRPLHCFSCRSVCGQVVTSSPSLRVSERMYMFQP